MNRRDSAILQKICEYCDEISKTHIYFKADKALFYDQKRGFVYRNSIVSDIPALKEKIKKIISSKK